MSDLRDRIADALRAHTYAGKGGSGSDCGGVCDCPDRCTCGATFSEWTDHFADVAAGVVGPEIAARDGQISDLEQADAGSAAALARVRALHKPFHGWPDKRFCKACENPWPCATIRTIDGSTNE